MKKKEGFEIFIIETFSFTTYLCIFVGISQYPTPKHMRRPSHKGWPWDDYGVKIIIFPSRNSFGSRFTN